MIAVLLAMLKSVQITSFVAPRSRSGRGLVVDAATSMRLGRIRQRDTRAELRVRSVLHRLGWRFRINNRDLPGSPDIANRSRRWAVLVHGCFWHAHPRCARATLPKRNRAFWREKFESNRARDKRVLKTLRQMGYRVVVIWECSVRDLEGLERQLHRALADSAQGAWSPTPDG